MADEPGYGRRGMKQKVLSLLDDPDAARRRRELAALAPRQAINPLVSALCYTNDVLRWRAIAGVGDTVEQLAEGDRESARVIMRRFMWMLNDESGGIGWGVPQAMGEAMARLDFLAREFGPILVSYMHEQGNYLEYQALQRGLLWAIARVAQVRPEAVEEAVMYLPRFLESEDPSLRGHAAIAAGRLGAHGLQSMLRALVGQEDRFTTYENDQVVERKVGEVAGAAMDSLDEGRAHLPT